MKKTDILISIIVPVYNCSDFLSSIYYSLSNQNNALLGKDYEVIFINDGSTDNSFDILKTFVADGITVIDKPNGGVSSARNLGLNVAKGDYVWFVDGDDCISPYSLYILKQVLQSQKDLDAVVFDYKYVDNQFSVMQNVFLETSSSEELIYSSKCNLAEILTPWRICIRKEYLSLHNIRFVEGMSYGEDTLWMVIVASYPIQLKSIENQLYYYRQQPRSAVHTFNEKTIAKRFESLCYMISTYNNYLCAEDKRLTLNGRNMITERLYWSIQNLLFFSLQHPIYRDPTLKFLNQIGLRHYPVLYGRLLGSSSLGELKTNLLCLFLSSDYYYNFISKISEYRWFKKYIIH